MKKVTLKIRFADLLGNSSNVMTADERRSRWDAWKALDAEAAAWWIPDEVCSDCKHLDGDWCQLQELPASVNPLLSYQYGMPGMACMGAGKETVQ